jgi:hypothetical protein
MSRTTAVRVIAWILIASGVGFTLFTIVFGIVGPNQEIHAVHNAIVSALIVVLTVPPLVVVAREPEGAGPELTVLAALTLVGIGAMALSLTPDPFILPVLALIALLWFLAPQRGTGIPPGRPSIPLLVLAAGVAALLVPYLLENAGLQRTDGTSDHARFFHWVETAFFSGGIAILALLGAWRPDAFRLATWCAGVGLATLGAASLLFTGFASALPEPWGWLAVAAGVGLIGLGEWEARRREVAPTSAPATR